MKKTIAALVILTCVTAKRATAQSEHPYGQLSAWELEMKKCPFDPDANAVVLLDEGSADHDDQYHLITFNHRRIKILTEKGIGQADVSIPFYSDDQFEYIENIEAMTVNIGEDGSRKEYPVDRKSIYTKKTSKLYSEMKFAFPQVRPGSILEYRYRSVKKHYGGLSNWHFQERLPVCISSFLLRPAPNLEFTYNVQRDPRFKTVVKPSALNNTVYFEMDSLPGLGDEPYMDSREDYVQKVNFTITRYEGYVSPVKYMSDWDQVARELWMEPTFGAEIRANLREPDAIIAAETKSKTDLEKMGFIYDLVRKNVEWNGINSKYATDGVRAAWNKKTGTSGAINLLMVNLMKSAGLDVYPMLVSERGNGRINIKTPFINQFDNVYAAVSVNGKRYYLDASVDYIPASLTPYSILNSTALIVRNKSGELVEINESGKKFREIVYVTGMVSAEGKLKGIVQTVSKDYAQERKRHEYTKGKDKYIEDRLKKAFVNIDIDSVEITGGNSDSADFLQKFNIAGQLQSTGDYAFVNLNLFSGYTANEFVDNERFSNINFGYLTDKNISVSISVPSGWSLDALPKSIKMMNPDKSVVFTRQVVFDKERSQISARIRIEFNRSLYTADEYPDLKEFYKKMFAMLDEQVVFKTR